MFDVESKTVDREQSGVWKDYKGSKFLIAHINNPLFQKYYSRLLLPHRKAVDKGRLDPEIQLDVMAKCLSKHILLDWADVKNDVKYSVEAAEKLIRQNTEFREFVLEVAQDITQFLEEEKEELGKAVAK
jgi:hypothetical protein